MFKIDRDKNIAETIPSKTFSELGLKERDDLQEWIYNNPDILGEKLLIISKEFDRWDDTNERLDLLAIDLQGNLVIIENKSDTSGKDVVWQGLKYTAYCATLKKEDICGIFQKQLGKSADAAWRICEFLAKDYENLELNREQRIIFVARTFRKEVTSTVLYLNKYTLDIKCIKVTPYEVEDSLYLDTEQILPIQDIGDYQIKLAQKSRDEQEENRAGTQRALKQLEFWETALPVISEKVDKFKTRSATRRDEITTPSASRNITYSIKILNKSARVELYIDAENQEKTKEIFSRLYKNKSHLEEEFGTSLNWQESLEKRSSRIFKAYDEVLLDNEETWDTCIVWLAENIRNLINTFENPLSKAVNNVGEDADFNSTSA
ncbi:MAG: DUF4268 domain-containing protein [Micrococcaceae bacterium]